MVTQRGENVNVVAIHGNFDNAQSGVKAMFEDKELAEELEVFALPDGRFFVVEG